MLTYNLRLAWLSIRRNPVLTALMIAAIAVGIGVCMTTLTVYHLMARDPIPEKSASLYRVMLDNWDPSDAFHTGPDGDGPPFFLTYTDAIGLQESSVPTYASPMFRVAVVVEPDNPNLSPEARTVRAANREFFVMFDLEFVYGGPWGQAADETGERVVVISETFNESYFGGEDSVGRALRLSGESYRVVGVTRDWNPLPKFYEVNNGFFDKAEAVFMPYRHAVNAELERQGSTACWEPESIRTNEAFLASECVWIQYWAQLDTPAQRDEYQGWIDAYVSDQKALGRFPRPLDNRLIDVMRWLDHRGAVSEDSVVLVGLSFLFLAVCLINTIGLLLAKFAGNAPLVGLRRALGASKGMIFRQHLVEVAAIGFAGGLCGLLLTVGGLAAVRSWFADYERVAQLDWSMIVVAILLALAAAALAGLYPAWRVTRAAPAIYLKTQ